MLKSFLKEEKWKLLATTIVAGAFLYFWMKGPLVHTLEVLNLEHELSEFSIPKMVGELDKREKSRVGTVGDVETQGFGHSLILDRKAEKKYTDLLVSHEANPALSPETGHELLEHARTLSRDPSFELKATGELFYAESAKSKRLYFESKEVVTDIRGYAGEVNVGVFVDSEGRMTELHHISSKETESYLKKIVRAGFYGQFAGLKVEGRHTVDAVSGATLTTEAIAHTTTVLMDYALPEPLENFTGLGGVDAFSVEAELTWWWLLHITVIGLMFLYGIQKRLRKSKRGIIILSVLSALYIGFFLNNSFTYVSFIHPFVGTSVSSLVGIYALFTLLGAIWGKNTYCKYVCPFGNVQRLIVQITPKQTKAKFFISNLWTNRIRAGITLVLIAGVLLGMRSWSNFELFPDLFGLDFRSYWFALAVLTVLMAARYPMIWCRLLCPTGSVLDFISDAVHFKRK